MDLDIGLVQPVFVFVVRHSRRELGAGESGTCRRLRLAVRHLHLLVGALGACCLRGDDLEDSRQLIRREVESHRAADVNEVVLADGAQVVLVVGLVRLLGRQVQPLELLAEFGHEGILLVRRPLNPDAASGNKGPDEIQETYLLHGWPLLGAGAFPAPALRSLHLLVRLVDRFPEGLELFSRDGDA